MTRTMIHIFGVTDGKIQEEWAEGESLRELLRSWQIKQEQGSEALLRGIEPQT